MDIGKALLKMLSKLGKASMPQSAALTELELWLEKKLKRSRDPEKILDQANCMRIFINQADTLGEAMDLLESILHSNGPVKLMTGHKSKGLEFPHVFFLDEQLIGKKRQDPNLRYVIQTRAMETLTYVYLANFKGIDNAAD